MSDKPTGVFVRLPLSEEQREAFVTEMDCGAEAEQAILAIGTPVMGSNLDPSRECFEKFYAQMCAKATGHDTSPEYVSGLRTGDNYGGRTFLNNVWEA